MKNILVGIDFQEHSRLVLNKAIEVAKAFNSKIWLIHVSAPDPDFVGYWAGPVFIREERALELKKEHKLLTEYANEVKEEGIEADGLLIQGPTIETLLSEANKLHIDLIICGHHHHNFIYKIIFGNHSKDIIMKSDIPVLVVPI